MASHLNWAIHYIKYPLAQQSASMVWGYSTPTVTLRIVEKYEKGYNWVTLSLGS
jgi:hypothetical protein